MEYPKTMSANASDAILSLHPTAKFMFSGTDEEYLAGYTYDQLDWQDAEITKPSREVVDAEITRLQAFDYKNSRSVEYPSQGDQMDMIYKDNLNGTTTHKDAVEAVKTKWPKDNSGPVE